MHRLIFLLLLGFLVGCAPTQQKIQTPATAVADQPVDVWLMPLEGFPPQYAWELEKKFSDELGLKVRATVHAGRTPKMFGPSRQMIAERVLAEMKVPLERLRGVTPKTVIIVLTRDDLNNEDGNTRFVFATHFPSPRVSVVSLARLTNSFFGQPDSPTVTKLRLYKMVKKSIGLQYYEYGRTTDLNSVMYSPIMSLDDLDASGTRF